MRHPGLANPGSTAERGDFLTPLLQSLLTAAGIMGGISFILLPLSIRFILTPLLFMKVRRNELDWEDELSRKRSSAMIPLLKK
jgi:hypothetical protein